MGELELDAGRDEDKHMTPKTITYDLIETNDDGTETVREVTAIVIESREQLEALLAS